MEKILDGEISKILSGFLDLLPGEVGEAVTSPEGAVSYLGLDRLISEIGEILKGGGGALFSFFILALGAVALLHVVGVLPERVLIAECGVSVLLSYMLFVELYPVFVEAVEGLSELNGLFGGIMPTVVALISVSGGVTLAPTASVGMQITLYLTGLLSSGVMTRIVLAMLIVGSLSEIGGAVEGLSRSIKELFGKLVGILTAVLGGVIALETYITSVGDGAMIRMARLTAGNMIPIVGSAVSGALGTLAGGISYAAGVVGVGSVVMILSVALSPLVLLLGYRAALGAAELLLGFSRKKGGVSLISAFSSALDALISVYVMTVIIYVFELVALLMGVSSLV